MVRFSHGWFSPVISPPALVNCVWDRRGRSLFIAVKRKKKKLKMVLGDCCSLHLLKKSLISLSEPRPLSFKTEERSCQTEWYFQRWSFLWLFLAPVLHGDSDKAGLRRFVLGGMLQWRFDFRIKSCFTEISDRVLLKSSGEFESVFRVRTRIGTREWNPSRHVVSEKYAAVRWRTQELQLENMQRGCNFCSFWFWTRLLSGFKGSMGPYGCTARPRQSKPVISLWILVLFWAYNCDVARGSGGFAAGWGWVFGQIIQFCSYHGELIIQKRQRGAIEYNCFRAATYARWREHQLGYPIHYCSRHPRKLLECSFPELNSNCGGDFSLASWTIRNAVPLPSFDGLEWMEVSVPVTDPGHRLLHAGSVLTCGDCRLWDSSLGLVFSWNFRGSFTSLYSSALLHSVFIALFSVVCSGFVLLVTVSWAITISLKDIIKGRAKGSIRSSTSPSTTIGEGVLPISFGFAVRLCWSPSPTTLSKTRLLLWVAIRTGHVRSVLWLVSVSRGSALWRGLKMVLRFVEQSSLCRFANSYLEVCTSFFFRFPLLLWTGFACCAVTPCTCC